MASSPAIEVSPFFSAYLPFPSLWLKPVVRAFCLPKLIERGGCKIISLSSY